MVAARTPTPTAAVGAPPHGGPTTTVTTTTTTIVAVAPPPPTTTTASVAPPPPTTTASVAPPTTTAAGTEDVDKSQLEAARDASPEQQVGVGAGHPPASGKGQSDPLVLWRLRTSDFFRRRVAVCLWVGGAGQGESMRGHNGAQSLNNTTIMWVLAVLVE